MFPTISLCKGGILAHVAPEVTAIRSLGVGSSLSMAMNPAV